MFGFFIGTACLVGLFATLSHRRRHGFGHGHCGHRGMSPLWRALDRLDATPGQEKVIRSALDELREEGRAARRDFRASRDDVARVIREPELAPGAFDATFQKHDETLSRLRDAGVRAFQKIHETLDARQRDALASMVEGFGPGFFWFGRGHRGGSTCDTGS
jgi:Spy/CpxP family protein refolding chaperone